MSAQQAEALARLRAANRALLALRTAVRALPEPQPLAEVDACLSALERLYTHLGIKEQPPRG